MNIFSIRDIENLSGIKAHTLRVWEQRYGIIKPNRKDSRHRQYDVEDLKRILRISHLYNQGFKISRIAEMSDADICRLTIEAQEEGRFDVFINQLIEASIDYDEELFRRAVDAVIYHQGFENAMIQVVYPFLNKIGMLWLTGNIVPSQEHFATNIIRNKILLESSLLQASKSTSNKRYVLFCPPEEFHEIPLLFVQYCLKKRKVYTIFLGVNSSVGNLVDLFSRTQATHLFVHLTTNLSNFEPQQLLENLCATFPNVEVHAAGKVFEILRMEQNNLRIFEQLPDFFRFIEEESTTG